MPFLGYMRGNKIQPQVWTKEGKWIVVYHTRVRQSYESLELGERARGGFTHDRWGETNPNAGF